MKNNLGNMMIGQSGLINETECKGSVYFEISILIPKSQYDCVSTGVYTQYFLYKLIMISGKYQSYCYINSLSQRQETEEPGKTYNGVGYDEEPDCKVYGLGGRGGCGGKHIVNHYRKT